MHVGVSTRWVPGIVPTIDQIVLMLCGPLVAQTIGPVPPMVILLPKSGAGCVSGLMWPPRRAMYEPGLNGDFEGALALDWWSAVDSGTPFCIARAMIQDRILTSS